MGALAALAWIGARARWMLAIGVIAATFLPALSATLRPFLPALVVLVLASTMARLDLRLLARRAARPRRLAALLIWTMAMLVATPVLVWAAAWALGLPDIHLASLVYTFISPPIASSAAMCLMLGLEAGLAIELTVLASLLTPLTGPFVAKLLLGETVPIDALDLSLRVAVIMAAGVVGGLVIRAGLGVDRIERNGAAFDGVTTIILVIFVVPLFDRFWELVLRDPGFALAILALVLVANWGGQAVMAVAGRRVATPQIAGAAALMWGTRNISVYLAALPPDPLFGLYVAFYQIPMLFTPLVLGRILRGRP